MDEAMLQRFLPDEGATARLGEDIALALKPGDVITLEGELGAGKTTLARAIIRTLSGDPNLEVPSPTFTLVQAYDARFPVYHFDLYRIGSADELDELGLEESAGQGVTIIEWPQRAEGRLPAPVVTIRLSQQGDGRNAAISGPADAMTRIRRSLAIRSFLGEAGWGDAHRAFLQGDASTRIYEKIFPAGGGKPCILMNAARQADGPPIRAGKPYSQIAHLAESVVPFVALAKTLRARRISAPEIYSQDLDQGLLLLEDLGSGGFLDGAGRPVPERYLAAAELLADIHANDWPHRMEAAPGVWHQVPPYDRHAMMIEAELLLDWYLPAETGQPVTGADRAGFAAAWEAVIGRLADKEKGLVLRDFHSPNIIWREKCSGADRLGIIDFQDALIGPSAYDVASLAQDARVTIPADLERRVVDAYCGARAARRKPFDRAAFEEAYAIMAAQRSSKILGIFVRLDRRDGKPQYLKHLPRMRAYAARALEHPALAPVRDFYMRHQLVEGELA